MLRGWHSGQATRRMIGPAGREQQGFKGSMLRAGPLFPLARAVYNVVPTEAKASKARDAGHGDSVA